MSNKYIGEGITFPIKLNEKGRVEKASTMDLLKYSMANIFMWPKGHRFFNNRFGSRLHELLEEPNDSISNALIRSFIRESLIEWESRVQFDDVKVSEDKNNTKLIEVFFTVKQTREKESFVFPFYEEIKN